MLLAALNFFVLQWFTLRLFVVQDGPDYKAFGLFANIVPLTGWDFTWAAERYVVGDASKLVWAWTL